MITTFVNYLSIDNKHVVLQPVLLTYRYGNDPFCLKFCSVTWLRGNGLVIFVFFLIGQRVEVLPQLNEYSMEVGNELSYFVTIFEIILNVFISHQFPSFTIMPQNFKQKNKIFLQIHLRICSKVKRFVKRWDVSPDACTVWQSRFMSHKLVLTEKFLSVIHWDIDNQRTKVSK